MRYNNVLSRRVDYYAQRVLRELGLEEPPIPVGRILDYFGLDLKRIQDSEADRLAHLSGKDIETPAFLLEHGDSATIFVKESDRTERQRLSIFHECGHYDIPWHHEQGNFLCDCGDPNLFVNRELEKEAFEYAACLMFPLEVFAADVTRLPFGIDSITSLSESYGASFEATAIRYVHFRNDKCAVAYLDPNPEADDPGHPFVVRYSVRSKRFYGYWRPGEQAQYHDLLASCFQDRRRVSGEIPAVIFGSSKKHTFVADIRPYGPTGVCALLQIPDGQTVLF